MNTTLLRATGLICLAFCVAIYPCNAEKDAPPNQQTDTTPNVTITIGGTASGNVDIYCAATGKVGAPPKPKGKIVVSLPPPRKPLIAGDDAEDEWNRWQETLTPVSKPISGSWSCGNSETNLPYGNYSYSAHITQPPSHCWGLGGGPAVTIMPSAGINIVTSMSDDDSSIHISGTIYVPKVTIGPIERAPGLPPSICFRKTKTIPVTVVGMPPGYHIELIIAGYQTPGNGNAEIISPADGRIDGGGTTNVEIKGTQQTETGHSSQLALVARMVKDDLSMILDTSSSVGFSVCSHPVVVKASHHSSVSGGPNPAQMWGNIYRMHYTSDSDLSEDLNQAQSIEKMYAENGTGVFSNFRIINSSWLPLGGDHFDFNTIVASADHIKHILELGTYGHVEIRQHMAFACDRCGILPDASTAPSVDNSGFTIHYYASRSSLPQPPMSRYTVGTMRLGMPVGLVGAGISLDSSPYDVDVP